MYNPTNLDVLKPNKITKNVVNSHNESHRYDFSIISTREIIG